MNGKYISGILISSLILMMGIFAAEQQGSTTEQQVFSWVVIGDGPSGIVTLAVLESVGVDLRTVLWIGPEFAVGRMGKYYAQVPANTTARTFVSFLDTVPLFRRLNTPSVQLLRSLDQDKEYPLKFIIDPLQDATNVLLAQVQSMRGLVSALEYKDGCWNIGVENRWYRAERAVLALGAHPRSLGYPCKQEIPLDYALNKSLLSNYVTADDTVAVVGGAHSAVLVMKFLCEAGAGRIVNFYRHPLYYLPKDLSSSLSARSRIPRELNFEEGTQAEAERRACTPQAYPLSGMAAEWAREVLDKKPPVNLWRMKNSPEALRAWLPICTKIVYASGFERNQLPAMSSVDTSAYDPSTGIIGQHLFGIGIAFPELVEDPVTGTCTSEIGLVDFIRFAQRMVPEWMLKQPLNEEAYRMYERLFTIVQL